MGKREIGELSPFDLVVAIMIGELVVIPVHDRSITLVQGIAPILFLVLLEILISTISIKSESARKIINESPTVLVKDGIILEGEMRQSRYTNQELLSELRKEGIRCPGEVEYAILEPGGDVSVFPKSQYMSPTLRDLGIHHKDEGMPIQVINDGHVIKQGLKEANISEGELLNRIKEEGYKDPKEIFFGSMNNKGKIYLSPKKNHRGRKS